MKSIFAILLTLLVFSCHISKNKHSEVAVLTKAEKVRAEAKEIRQYIDEMRKLLVDTTLIADSTLQSIIDSSNVKGSILIYDVKNNKSISNDFARTNVGFLPASTFKIPNSIIALETGVIENDSTVIKWNGEKRRIKLWEQDLRFKEAFHYSCVPCYQEIARKVGVVRMQDFLKKLQFGNMKVDSASIDLFWLEGESNISQIEQIDFLKRFYYNKLPIKSETTIIMKRLMTIEKNENYTFSGKSGWAIRNNNNVGWFVGYLETKDNTYFFATNVEPNENFNMDLFPMIRKEMTLKAFRKLNIIE